MGKYGKNRLPVVKFSSHCGQSIRGRLLRGYRRKIGQLQLGRCRHGDVSKLGLSMLLESKIFFVVMFAKKQTTRSLPKFLGTYFSRLPQWMRLCCAMLCQLTSASMVVSQWMRGISKVTKPTSPESSFKSGQHKIGSGFVYTGEYFEMMWYEHCSSKILDLIILIINIHNIYIINI